MKIYYGLVSLVGTLVLLVSPCFVEATGSSIFEGGATKLVDDIYRDQKRDSDTVQNTSFDNVSSTACNELRVDERFTIFKTLCYIKEELHNYLQYVIYIGLSAAVMLLIWNGFKLITASNREEQMKKFTTNLKYIIIWVILLVSFYAIIEIFVTIVNLISPNA